MFESDRKTEHCLEINCKVVNLFSDCFFSQKNLNINQWLFTF